MLDVTLAKSVSICLCKYQTCPSSVHGSYGVWRVDGFLSNGMKIVLDTERLYWLSVCVLSVVSIT